MADTYPKCIVLWRGAILGGLVHAIMSAQNALWSSFRNWQGQDYVVMNMEGTLGMISFDGECGQRIVGTFFDSQSPQSPYRASDYDPERLFLGMSPCHRCLLETRRRLAVDWDEGVPCVTAAFWDDGEEYLTAATPWQVVLDEGGKLIHIELIEDITEAITEWQTHAGMTPEQAALTRSLFDRKMTQQTGMIDLTKDEVAFLRSTSEKPSDEQSDEERLTACRHRLAALGILFP